MKLLALSALFVAVFGQEIKNQQSQVLVTSQPDKNQGFNPEVNPMFINGPPMLGKQQFNPLFDPFIPNGPPMVGRQQFNPQIDPFIPNGPPMVGKQQFNPLFDPFIPNGPPMVGREQFNPNFHNFETHNQQKDLIPFRQDMPLIGQQQFNPFELDGSKSRHQRKNKHKRNHDKMERQHRDKNLRQIPGDENIGHDQWERHIEGNHMQKSRFHRKMWRKFIFAAIFFTLFGVCLSKCCRKCKKNKKKRIQQIMRRTRTANQVMEQIKKQEKKLQQLKSQLEIKKADQQSFVQSRRHQQDYRLNRQREMRAMSRQTQGQYYHHPNQANWYNPGTQIPVGRPVNQQHHSNQFIGQYPQL